MIRVVLADDQALLRQGVKSLLELTKEVAVVAEAETGSEALAQIVRMAPDVALLDVRMPSLTGVDVVAELRNRGNQTPVILLTTFDDDVALLAGVRAGIAGFLLKDVAIEGLLTALRTVTAGGSLILPAITERAARLLKEHPGVRSRRNA